MTERREFEKIIVSAMLFHKEDIVDKNLLKNRLTWYWNGLSKYSLSDVMAGINAHNQVSERGRFMPNVAEIVEQIEQARQARRWEARQLPAESTANRRGAGVPAGQRHTTLSEYLALSAYELRELEPGQTPESVAAFKGWLGGLAAFERPARREAGTDESGIGVPELEPALAF